MKYRIQDLKQTCFACPSQWSGMTTEGATVYGRYRWGYLSLDINNVHVYGRQLGDDLDGVMSTSEFLGHVSEVAELSSGWEE